MKNIIFITIFSLGSLNNSKAQVIERYIDDDFSKTTVIEKNPDATDMDVLDDLNKGSFGLTEVVFIKDYSHDTEVVEEIETETTLNNLELDSERGINYTASTSMDDLESLVANVDVPDLSVEYSVASPIKKDEIKTVKASTVSPEISSKENNLDKSTMANVLAANEKVNTANNTETGGSQTEQVRPERNPIGEKVKRKRRRLPRWKSDRRGNNYIFKCFKFGK